MDIFVRVTALALLLTLVLSLPFDANPEKNPEEGEFFEGDMILNEEQLHFIQMGSSDRNGLILSKYRWPNRVVPYHLSSSLTKMQKKYIVHALKTIELVSCIRFVKRTKQPSFVNVTSTDSGCYSSVGYQNKSQVLNLQDFKPGTGCFRLSTIMHEFLHALGFYHMQSAYDRDEYVTIQWDNLIAGTEHNFNKYNNSIVTHYNTSYDYRSVMHYNGFGFSKNGKPTIVPTDESYMQVIGQREGLSDKDILKLNMMYNCEKDDEVDITV